MARPTLYNHHKFRQLCLVLKSPAVALGSLEFVWSAGYQSGNPFVGSSDVVEDLAHWRGKKGELTRALVSCGFLDASADGYRIHDLLDHAPDYVQKRRKRELSRGHRPDSDRTVTGHRPDSDRTVTSTPARTPSPTLPLTPTRAQSHAPAAPAASGDGPSRDGLEQQRPEQPEQPNGHSPNEPPVDVGALVAGIFPRRATTTPVDEDARREELRRQAREITTAAGGAP